MVGITCLSYLFMPAWAENMSVKPKKCVTLKQGNICYQGITGNWSTAQAGHYCLTLSTRIKPVKCWKKSAGESFKFEFAEKQTTTLNLVDQARNQILNEQVIEVKWVYNTRKYHSRWRLF